ncbi:MAG: zinc ribbon domain-containing protein [Candidatus Omnitrophota bacterium]
MPTYDFECTNCNHHFEAFQTMSAKPLVNCPKCHKPKLKRLIGTGSGVIFKGSGFYQTDYKNKPVTKDKQSKSSKSCSTCSSDRSSCSTCK